MSCCSAVPISDLARLQVEREHGSKWFLTECVVLTLLTACKSWFQPGDFDVIVLPQDF